jgi:hypothetical protein
MSVLYRLYSDELTLHERQLGFELRETWNPQREIVGQPLKIRAVLLVVSPTDRIIKLNLPTGHCGYHLQRFGRWEWQPEELADWKPLSEVMYPTAEMALCMVQRGLTCVASALQPRVIPVDSGKQY